MTLRRQKIEQVLELREQTLQERAGALSEANQGRAIAQEHAESAADHLEQAARYRQSLTNGSINVAAWIEAEQWLAQRNRQLDQAQVQLQGAEHRVSEAYDHVIEARSGVKQMELLGRRVESQELRQQRRLEQKINDELAQRRFATSRRLNTD
jgi:flagellar export protein FliJ